MTSTLAPNAGALLEAAAAAAMSALTIGEPVTPVDLTADSGTDGAADSGALDTMSAAVLVPFTGRVQGEFAILVDEQVQSALGAADADLVTLLGPAVSAVAAEIGEVAVGAAQAVDPRLARNRIASFADQAVTGLRGAQNHVRAAVAIGINPADAPGIGATGREALADRLDLLRGVEMQASVELGRARMTVNELLSLRAGAVVELDRAAGDPVDLFVNGRLMARGEVVVLDENYAVRITHIVGDER